MLLESEGQKLTKIAFGARLKRLRIMRGMEQGDLAERAGIEKNNISNYEIGYNYPRIEVFYRLCIALNCSADELLGFKHVDITAEEYAYLAAIRMLDDVGHYAVRSAIDAQFYRINKSDD